MEAMWDETLDSSALYVAGYMAALLVFAWALFFVVRAYLLRLIRSLTQGISRFWAELVFDGVLLSRVSWVVPVLLIHYGVALVPGAPEGLIEVVRRISLAALVVVTLRSMSRFFTKLNEIYIRYPMAKNRPIKGYLQVILIISSVFGVILAFSILLDKSPVIFLSGLGAMTAILMLVFRDTILSFVAGVQLTTNDLIQVGDWIEMPQFGADGDVIDIALHAVMVQNWDRTITVIPTHKFLEHSFKNWRGMKQSGGRRIKRSIHIDLNTVRFLNDDEIRRLSRFSLLREYIERKQIELRTYNAALVGGQEDLAVNSRRLTNIGTFRAYIHSYLQRHPQIHKGMTLLVRQLQPGATGVPLEVYAFSSDIAWGNYEGLQADIFDHIFAIAPEFGLRLYQNPSGNDLLSWRGAPAVETDETEERSNSN